MEEPNLIFQKLGGGYQLAIESPEDLFLLEHLDESHWAATSVPNDILSCDPEFLRHLDTDRNGRIRTDEIRDAARWTLNLLSDRSEMMKISDSMAVNAIDSESESGRMLQAVAKRILDNLNAEDKTRISVSQLRDRKRIVASGAANGDGVIPPEAVPDKRLREFVTDIIATTGGVDDASGVKGVTAATLDEFLAEAKSHLDWQDKKLSGGDIGGEDITFTDEQAEEAHAAFRKIEAKMDQYFALCSLARMSPDLAQKASIDGAPKTIEWNSPGAIFSAMSQAPLSEPDPAEQFALAQDINPVYREAVADFERIIMPQFAQEPHPSSLSRELWAEIKTAFKPYSDWLNSKTGDRVEHLGREKLEEYLNDDLQQRLRQMISEDEAVASELKRIDDLEKLLLCHKWLMELANNLVSFPRLYNPETRSLIEIGTLIMDGRKFTFNIKVGNRKEHKQIAERSRICLIYSEIARGENERMEIATAVTAGNMENLFCGKKGVFFTTDGREWDARVVDIIESPVSLCEAVKQPFKKLAEFIGKQAERFSSSRYESIERSVGTAVTEADKSMAAPPKPDKKPTGNQSGAVRDMLLGGGVAVVALGTAISQVGRAVQDGGFLLVVKILLGFVALLAVPALTVAWIKLRRRNLGSLLEASGMAVNLELRLGRRIGQLFTRIQPLPESAKKRRRDLASSYMALLPENARRGIKLGVAILIGLILGCGVGYGYVRVSRLLQQQRMREALEIPVVKNTNVPDKASLKKAADKKTPPATVIPEKVTGQSPANASDKPADKSGEAVAVKPNADKATDPKPVQGPPAPAGPIVPPLPGE